MAGNRDKIRLGRTPTAVPLQVWNKTYALVPIIRKVIDTSSHQYWGCWHRLGQVWPNDIASRYSFGCLCGQWERTIFQYKYGIPQTLLAGIVVCSLLLVRTTEAYNISQITYETMIMY